MSFRENLPTLNKINQLNMVISQATHTFLTNHWNYVNLYAAFTRIYYVIDGHAQIFVNGECIDLLPGNIYVIPAKTIFSGKCDKSLEKIFFHINLFENNNLDCFSTINKCIILKDRFEEIKWMKDAFEKDDFETIFKIRTKLYAILDEVISVTNHQFKIQESLSPEIEKVLEYIKNNPSYSLTTKELSEELYISTSQIQRKFNALFGISLSKFIHSYVISCAEIELRTTNKTIEQISSDFGFCDQFYFSRCFKQEYGIPPMVYRKTLISHS